MKNILRLTLPSDRQIRVTRMFDAPRQLVWDAMTRAELLRQSSAKRLAASESASARWVGKDALRDFAKLKAWGVCAIHPAVTSRSGGSVA